jgi:dUTP pyrophosphatase
MELEGPHVVTVPIQRLPHAPAQLPSYATDGAAGMDLRLAGDDQTLQPGERALLPTGFCIAVPTGFEAQIRLRSGFALRTGLILLNAPGTIDSDYRGEVKVLIMNPGSSAVQIPRGERFAQLVVCPVARCTWDEMERLPESTRNSGGFGSTGKA